MLTASQIAKKLKLTSYTTRYRLTQLLNDGQIKAEKVGNTWTYSDETPELVKKYDKRK